MKIKIKSAFAQREVAILAELNLGPGQGCGAETICSGAVLSGAVYCSSMGVGVECSREKQFWNGAVSCCSRGVEFGVEQYFAVPW